MGGTTGRRFQIRFGMWAGRLIAVIVTCAYVGYKEIDCDSGCAYGMLGMNEADLAGFTASSSYIPWLRRSEPDSWGPCWIPPRWCGPG